MQDKICRTGSLVQEIRLYEVHFQCKLCLDFPYLSRRQNCVTTSLAGYLNTVLWAFCEIRGLVWQRSLTFDYLSFNQVPVVRKRIVVIVDDYHTYHYIKMLLGIILVTFFMETGLLGFISVDFSVIGFFIKFNLFWFSLYIRVY
jgi:hypothetical protein